MGVLVVGDDRLYLIGWKPQPARSLPPAKLAGSAMRRRMFNAILRNWLRGADAATIVGRATASVGPLVACLRSMGEYLGRTH